MGAALSNRASRNQRKGYKPDTAILVQSEVSGGHHGFSRSASSEELALDITGSMLALHGLRFGYGFPQGLDSPSDCTTLSTVSTVTATPLDHKYRYHLLFAYHERDRPWVEDVVRRLEADPYNFQCCYADRDSDDKVTRVQNVLCSIMLSQRIVVVLTPSFVAEEWGLYEETITHLTSLSQRRQRVLPVLLEECDIPESLKTYQPVDVSHDAFWDGLLQCLQLDGLPYSESLYTVRSLSSQSSGYHNAQVLATISTTVTGFFRPCLLFDYDEVPDTLSGFDVGLTRHEYADIMKSVGREDAGQKLSWLFSALPTILLASVFVCWCVAFILVIVLFPDNAPSTLPVRLCVFSLPAIFIVLGCVFRWRRLKQSKDKYSMCMFSRSVHINRILYQKTKSVIVSTARTRDDHFYIYFLYYNRTECIERIKLFLTHCSDGDMVNLSKLVEVYTLNSGYLEDRPLAVRLAVMMSSAYAISLIFKRLPHTLERRHTKRRQCLCQFVEDFLAVYLPCVRQETNLHDIKHIFLKYLNCNLKTDAVLLEALGVSVIEA